MTTIEQLIKQLPSKEEGDVISKVMEFRGRLAEKLLQVLRSDISHNLSGGKKLQEMGLDSYAKCYIPVYEKKHGDEYMAPYYDNWVPFCYDDRDEFTNPATLFMFRLDDQLRKFLGATEEALKEEDILTGSVLRRIPKNVCGEDLADLYVNFYSESSEKGRSLILCLVGDNGEEEYFIPTVISNEGLLAANPHVLMLLSRGA